MPCWFVSKLRSLQKNILLEELFDQEIETYRNLLEINYKNITFWKKGKMHKMHKRNEILKNSCDGTQRAIALQRKR
jgi:hypothetical protein